MGFRDDPDMAWQVLRDSPLTNHLMLAVLIWEADARANDSGGVTRIDSQPAETAQDCFLGATHDPFLNVSTRGTFHTA